jgi:predicted metal-dependent phosphotriesterase family hydrolase
VSRVQTVTGDVDPASLGFTLPHEHVWCRLWDVPRNYSYEGQVEDPDVLAAELGQFVARDGRTLVDVTLPGIGRDPLGLREMSERTGLTIVMGTGFYREPYYPPEARIDRRSVESIADEMVGELTHGVGDSGVRAGIIGEIGTDKDWISAQEERVHRAAAQAQIRTGATITTHSIYTRIGLEQLELFEREGADPNRVIVGHCGWYAASLELCLEIIATGASVQFDMFGHTDQYTVSVEAELLGTIVALLERGHGDRILLSQDVCYAQNLTRYGGNGYTYLQDVLLPRLRSRGASEADVVGMTVTNPARLLAIESPA